jgi:hypothetical protein
LAVFQRRLNFSKIIQNILAVPGKLT